MQLTKTQVDQLIKRKLDALKEESLFYSTETDLLARLNLLGSEQVDIVLGRNLWKEFEAMREFMDDDDIKNYRCKIQKLVQLLVLKTVKARLVAHFEKQNQ